MLSLGLMKSSQNKNAKKLPSSILTIPPYNSLGALQKTNASAFNTQITAFFDGSGGVASSMTSSGSSLLESIAKNINSGATNFWVNNDGTRSDYYLTKISEVTQNLDDINTALLYGGTNESHPDSGITKELMKFGLEKFVQFLREDMGIVYTFLTLNHRAMGGTINDANWQIVKEAQLEFIAQTSNVFPAAEIYDLAIADAPDNVHPSASAYASEIPRRQAQQMAKYYKRSGASGASGPTISGAEFRTDHILLDIAHDQANDGNDLSVPSGCELVFAYDVGGTIYRASDVERLNSTTLKVNFDNKGFMTPSGDHSFKIGYGAMVGLDRAAPEVVRDNASNPLPLRQSIITPIVADPFIGMDYTFDLSAKAGIRTITGADITQITDRSNAIFTSSAGRYPHYSAGALVDPDASTSLRSPVFSSNNQMMGFIVADIPETIPNNARPFLCFGGSTTGQTSSRSAFGLYANGHIYVGRNAANNFEVFEQDYRGQRIILGFNCNASGNVDIYLNSGNITRSFIAHASFAAQTYMWLFALSHSESGNIGVGIPRIWFRNQAHGLENDTSISNCIHYLADAYEITL